MSDDSMTKQKSEKVNITFQIISLFIPFLPIWTYYRIRRLQKALLVALLCNALVYGSLMGVIYLDKIEEIPEPELDTEKMVGHVNPDDLKPELSNAGIGVLLMVLVAYPASIAIPIYFMYRWSKQWNQKVEDNKIE